LPSTLHTHNILTALYLSHYVRRCLTFFYPPLLSLYPMAYEFYKASARGKGASEIFTLKIHSIEEIQHCEIFALCTFNNTKKCRFHSFSPFIWCFTLFFLEHAKNHRKGNFLVCRQRKKILARTARTRLDIKLKIWSRIFPQWKSTKIENVEHSPLRFSLGFSSLPLFICQLMFEEKSTKAELAMLFQLLDMGAV
jgi:hypothetical protein